MKLSVNLSITVLNNPGCQSQAVQKSATQLLNTLKYKISTKSISPSSWHLSFGAGVWLYFRSSSRKSLKTGYSPGSRFTVKTAVYTTILLLLHFCWQFLLLLSTSQSIALFPCETRPPTDKLWSWRNPSSFLSSHHFPTSLFPLRLSIIWRLLGFNPPVSTQSFLPCQWYPTLSPL